MAVEGQYYTMPPPAVLSVVVAVRPPILSSQSLAARTAGVRNTYTQHAAAI